MKDTVRLEEQERADAEARAAAAAAAAAEAAALQTDKEPAQAPAATPGDEKKAPDATPKSGAGKSVEVPERDRSLQKDD